MMRRRRLRSFAKVRGHLAKPWRPRPPRGVCASPPGRPRPRPRGVRAARCPGRSPALQGRPALTCTIPIEEASMVVVSGRWSRSSILTARTCGERGAVSRGDSDSLMGVPVFPARPCSGLVCRAPSRPALPSPTRPPLVSATLLHTEGVPCTCVGITSCHPLTQSISSLFCPTLMRFQ